MMIQYGAVPAFRLSPSKRALVNRLRLRIDIPGLIAVHTLLPFSGSFPGWLSMFLPVYGIMALVTVLTVDPTRLPEAATTRFKQKKAWLFAAQLAPVWLVAGALLCRILPVPLPHPAVPTPGMLLGLYTDELIYRNIVQPALRKLGLSRYSAILLQSSLYVLPYLLSGKPVGFTLCLFLLGCINGFIVAKYRSLWPAFANSLIARVFLG